MTINPARMVYSRLRKVIAPSWIASEISTISGVPAGDFLM